MDPVTMIETALATGAAAAVKDSATDAVKSAYARLKGLVGKRLDGRRAGEVALAEHEAEPEVWGVPLKAELTKAGADQDADLVAMAKALLELVDAAGSRAGKYHVTITGSQGVQLGDHNTQTNTFTSTSHSGSA
jgi:hypothetical protein